jgi:hypothetical protein
LNFFASTEQTLFFLVQDDCFQQKKDFSLPACPFFYPQKHTLIIATHPNMSQKQLIDRIRVAIKRVQVTGAEKRQKWCQLILDHVQSANTLPRWQKVWPKAPQELTLFACRCGDVVLM